MVANLHSNVILWEGDEATELSLRNPLVESAGLEYNGREGVLLVSDVLTGASRIEFYSKDA